MRLSNNGTSSTPLDLSLPTIPGGLEDWRGIAIPREKNPQRPVATVDETRLIVRCRRRAFLENERPQTTVPSTSCSHLRGPEFS